MHKKKGIALFLVLFTSLVLFIIIIGLLYVLGANLRQLEAYYDRVRAYYLTETAASVAILDIRNGNIGRGPGQWTERAFNFVLDGKAYPLKYTVTMENQEWIVTTETTEGIRPRYYLRVGGQRAFPIFIRGFGGR